MVEAVDVVVVQGEGLEIIGNVILVGRRRRRRNRRRGGLSLGRRLRLRLGGRLRFRGGLRRRGRSGLRLGLGLLGLGNGRRVGCGGDADDRRGRLRSGGDRRFGGRLGDGRGGGLLATVSAAATAAKGELGEGSALSTSGDGDSLPLGDNLGGPPEAASKEGTGRSRNGARGDNEGRELHVGS